MHKLTLIILIAFVSINLTGQSKSEVINKGIETVKVYEQRLDKGFDDKYLVEETTYDASGRIIEIKETGRKGIIKKWEKYKYDKDGNCIEEIYLTLSGNIDKRVVINYTEGLKVSKEFYNSDGKLYRKKLYEYQYR